MKPVIHKVEQFTLLKVGNSKDQFYTKNRDEQPISATPKRGARIYDPSASLVLNKDYRKYFGDKIFEVAYTPENVMISSDIAKYAIQYKNDVYRINKMDELPNRSGFRIFGKMAKPGTEP